MSEVTQHVCATCGEKFDCIATEQMPCTYSCLQKGSEEDGEEVEFFCCVECCDDLAQE